MGGHGCKRQPGNDGQWRRAPREEDEEEEEELGAGARTRWGPPAGTSVYGVGELCSSLSWVMGRGTPTLCCNMSSRVY